MRAKCVESAAIVCILALVSCGTRNRPMVAVGSGLTAQVPPDYVELDVDTLVSGQFAAQGSMAVFARRGDGGPSLVVVTSRLTDAGKIRDDSSREMLEALGFARAEYSVTTEEVMGGRAAVSFGYYTREPVGAGVAHFELSGVDVLVTDWRVGNTASASRQWLMQLVRSFCVEKQ